METMNSPLGRHMLLELYQCPQHILDSIPAIEKILLDVVDQIKATFVSKSFHHFSPHGVSGVVVIAESHITIHSWPEHGYAAIDVFTCDEKINYQLVEDLMVEKFKSAKHQAQTITRGEI